VLPKGAAEAGRDFFQLMVILSLAPSWVDKRMKHAFEVWVPWMQQEEADMMTNHILSLPEYERKVTARDLGLQLQLTNDEREQLCLWPIKPIDKTDDELAEQRRLKNNARRRAKRGRTRAEYLAASVERAQPWIAEGMSRRSWYRKRGTGCDATILCKEEPNLCQSVPAESQRRGLHESGEFLRLVEPIHTEQAESPEKWRSHELRPHLCQIEKEKGAVAAWNTLVFFQALCEKNRAQNSELAA
jgi:hypothetical protein